MHMLVWFIFAAGGNLSGSAEFKTLKSCEAAKAALIAKYPNWGTGQMGSIECYPK